MRMMKNRIALISTALAALVTALGVLSPVAEAQSVSGSIYYGPSAPAPIYVQPQAVYVEPQPIYVEPPAYYVAAPTYYYPPPAPPITCRHRLRSTIRTVLLGTGDQRDLRFWRRQQGWRPSLGPSLARQIGPAGPEISVSLPGQHAE
jgi:hypothetical protein